MCSHALFKFVRRVKIQDFLLPLLGGGLIGIAVSLMLFLNGRVTGVSGIVSGALRKPSGDFGWRISFILGLIVGGFALRLFSPQMLNAEINRSLPMLILAGLLVGYGTVLGSGCTSGHGICGISRVSRRSILATVIFILFGMIAATFFRIATGVSA